MLNRIDSILQQKCHLDPEKKVLVGVSGGGDSLCLLDLLSRTGYPVEVAHFNHGLRTEANAEAEFVEKMAAERSLPFILGDADVLVYSRSQRLSMEEAARHLRYAFLFERAKQAGAQAVAVAHHADDQVETILMHFLRGSGISGLRGMRYWSLPNPWSEEIPLVRPLLEVWREEIDAYLGERMLQPVEDQSNRDTAIFRNRLRHELVPYLSTYNPGIRKVISRMGQVLDWENELLEGMANAAWEEACLESGPGYVAFRFNALGIQPKGLQRRLIRRGIEILRPGLRDIDFNTVARAVDFLEAPTKSRRLELAAGLHILYEEGKLWLADERADLPQGFWPQLSRQDDQCEEIQLELPSTIHLKNGWVLKCSLVEQVDPAHHKALANVDTFQTWIDASTARFPLTLRCRRPGERFKPAGMAGSSIKVSDFMINVKMPSRARDRWPLVYSGEDLVWIPGYRISQAFLLSGRTKEAAHLHLFRMDEV